MYHHDTYNLFRKGGEISLISVGDSPIRFNILPHSLLVWPPDQIGRVGSILKFGVGIETPNGGLRGADELYREQIQLFFKKLSAFCDGSPEVVTLSGCRFGLMICHYDGSPVVTARVGWDYINSVDVPVGFDELGYHRRLSVAFRTSCDSIRQSSRLLSPLCDKIERLASNEFRDRRNPSVRTPSRIPSEPIEPERPLVDPSQGFAIAGVREDMSEFIGIPSICIIFDPSDCELQVSVIEFGEPDFQWRSGVLNFSPRLPQFSEDVRDTILGKRRTASIDISTHSIVLEIIRNFDQRLFLRCSIGRVGELTALLDTISTKSSRSVGFEAVMEVETTEIEKLVQNLHAWADRLFGYH